MTRKTRRAAATIAAATTGAATLAVPALSTAGSTQSIHGDLKAGGFIKMDFDAKRSANGQVSGFLEGDIVVNGAVPMGVKGPITCFEVRGNRIGLFYPVTDSKPSIVKKAMRGVQITVATDGKGKAKAISFVPTASPDAKSCAPTVGMIPASGQAIIGS